MKAISYISNISIPLIIVFIVGFGIKENKNVYDLFIEGVKEGLNIVIKLFPTVLGIFVAVGMIRNSGAFDYLTKLIENITGNKVISAEILPLATMKPISGSASLAIGTEIMKTRGVDSKIGKIAATMMGSTETTFYIIAIYTSCIKVKKTKEVLFVAILADITGVLVSILIWQYVF